MGLSQVVLGVAVEPGWRPVAPRGGELAYVQPVEEGVHRPAGRIAEVIEYPVQGPGMPHAAQVLPATGVVTVQRAVDRLVDSRDEEVDRLGGEVRQVGGEQRDQLGRDELEAGRGGRDRAAAGRAFAGR